MENTQTKILTFSHFSFIKNLNLKFKINSNNILNKFKFNFNENFKTYYLKNEHGKPRKCGPIINTNQSVVHKLL